MRVLVIGGNRFFGKRLVSKLLDSQADVTLLNRGQSGDPFGDRVERIVVDRTQLSRERERLRAEAWDLVYDQACYEADDARSACEIFEGRVAHYVFTSSESVYRCKAGLSESDFDPLAHEFSRTADRNADYAEAKRQCEAVFFRAGAFPVTALRFPFVLGSDDYTGRLRFHVERIVEGAPIYFPDIEAKISLISADDAARALHFVSKLGSAAGPLNCASSEAISLRELVALIEKIGAKKARVLSDFNEEAHSPYGVESDWWMRVEKMRGLGFETRPWREWLPPLVESLLP